jgi:hypothetical protein
MYPSDRRILPLMVLATARERQQRSGFFFFIAEAYRQRVVPMARVLVLLTKSRKFWAPAPGAPRRARQVKKKKLDTGSALRVCVRMRPRAYWGDAFNDLRRVREEPVVEVGDLIPKWHMIGEPVADYG